MLSLWSDTASLPAFGRLDGDVKTDVLIIGGGICGVLLAYMLHRAGVDYVLAEAERIGGGSTKDTTAKITSQHGLIYDTLVKRFGLDQARLYLAANQDALDAYRTLCQDMDCDFEEQDALVFSRDDRNKLLVEQDALNRIGFTATLEDGHTLPFPVAGALRFPRQAQFHPLKFLSHIADGLRIHEGTAVTELIGCTAVTPYGRIHAERIVTATHFPFLDKHGGYFIKLYQSRSYVLALENAADVGGMYVDAAQNGLSFRNHGALLLLGGGGHRTGKPGGSWRALEELAAGWYPGSSVQYRWATQDCMTLDGMPYIGRYGAGTAGLYVASGFNKWGMTSAMTAATLLADLLQGKKNPYAALFSPQRSLLRPQLAVNALEATISLLTVSKPRCPHLGCALKWNPQERSWDCPCHGSRFDHRGHLIDNPATRDLKP